MKKLLFLTILMGLASCGVKGNPQPPLEPPYIGRGQPSFQKATKSLVIKKKKAKGDDDWKDEDEFTEDSPK